MATTIREIADLAGVSSTAVFFALNDKPGVGQETRDKVLTIAARLGYEQKKLKQTPSERTHVVRMLHIAKQGHSIYHAHRIFIDEYINGLEKEAKAENYRIEIQTIEGFDPPKVLQALNTGTVDGAVIIGTELDDNNLEFFSAVSVPTVIVYNSRPWLDLDFIDMNNESSVRTALEYLYDAGHRRIGLVKSLIETRNFRLRESAFLETMDRLGLPVAPADCFAIDPTFDKGRQDMTKLISGTHDLPSALFCVNDFIAYGCIQALKDVGKSIPDDVSIVGFDNLPSDDFMEPRLTSIKVSNNSIGSRAMHLLLERIADPGRPSEKVSISGELVVRTSVRTIPVPVSIE
jgi:DNA-binding LacI/PurR family transcriptional regulator